MTKAQLGSVSHGTLLPADLIPAFADLLRELSPNEYRVLLENWRDSLPHTNMEDVLADMDLSRWLDSHREDDDPSLLIDDLINALNECAPENAYFGACVGDGADFGFWLDDEEE